MSTFKKRSLLYLIFTFVFCFAVEAKAQRFAPTVADKREIIKILLEKTSKTGAVDTFIISTKNLPAEIKNNFPRIKNVKTQFVTEGASDSTVCPFEFGKFSVTGKLVTVSFGDCNEALAYSFKKVRGKWKSVPFVIEK
ncbi:MAG: hypothetical protein ABWZ66_04235 [Pyrinomonadaceae bacterium]